MKPVSEREYPTIAMIQQWYPAMPLEILPPVLPLLTPLPAARGSLNQHPQENGD